VDEEVKKRAKYAHFEIDRARRDHAAFVLLTTFLAARAFVIVDVGARDSLDEFLLAENTLSVFQHFPITLEGLRFVW
jgi:hypothetical protein